MQAAVGLLVGIVWLRQGKAAEQKSIFPITGALFIATTSSVGGPDTPNPTPNPF